MQLKALIHELEALIAFVVLLSQFAFQLKVSVTTRPERQQKFVTEEKQSKNEGAKNDRQHSNS